MAGKSIDTLIPDPQVLLSLEPEELAGYVLESLADSSDFHIGNLTSSSILHDYAPEYREPVLHALAEAFAWLEYEGLIAQRPGPMVQGWKFVTRRGQELKNRAGVDCFRKANILPRGLLHPDLIKEVWSDFLRGDYDSAVFKAFKEVEIEVRNAGKFAATDLGVDLRRKAFQSMTGPLTDASAPMGEREALSSLFAGAIGSYKNPFSHRRVQIDAEEAVEMIMLANHLLRIVEARKP
jgi:uncharacterized protein (TIGR02391 family)